MLDSNVRSNGGMIGGMLGLESFGIGSNTDGGFANTGSGQGSSGANSGGSTQAAAPDNSFVGAVARQNARDPSHSGNTDLGGMNVGLDDGSLGWGFVGRT